MTATFMHHTRNRQAGGGLTDALARGWLPRGVAVDKFYTPADIVGLGTLFEQSANNVITTTPDWLRVVTGAQVAGEFDGFLIPETFTVGDEWMIAHEVETDAALNMTGIRISAGTAGGDASVNLVNQERANMYIRSGTLNSSTSATAQLTAGELPWIGRWIMKIRYTAANSFSGQISHDGGFTWMGGNTETITLAPTHIGPTWCSYGGAVVDEYRMRFGFLAKLA